MKISKTIKKLFLLIPIGLGVFFLSSCSSSNVSNVTFSTDNNEIYAGDFNLGDYRLKVDYRNGKSEEIPVDESMIDENDLFKLYIPGTYDITFYYDNFYTTVTFIVKINHFSDDIRFITNDTFQNEEVFIQNYDGNAHSLELTNNIPTGTEVIFPDGNSFTESRSTPYTVRAILTKDGYEDKELIGKMYIKVSDYPVEELEKIAFNDLTEPYDSREKTIEATNVPNNLQVEYKIYDSNGRKVENAVDVGEYTVNATFSSTNHNYVIPEQYKTRTAKLTIEAISVNTSLFTLENIVKTYDGNSPSIQTLGVLPYGVTYEIAIYNNLGEIVNNPKDVGIYTAKLTFKTDNNHYPIPSYTTSTITINKRVIDLSTLSYGIEEVSYDGTEKRYSLLDNQLDTYLKANYEYYLVGTDTKVTPIEEGKYIVKISYEINNDSMDNFELINIPTDSAILVISNEGGE